MRKSLMLCWCFGLMSIFTFVSADYHSQVGQDKFVNENFFKGKRDGVFIDIGAYDGVTISNTYFFEKELNWTGICIEPLPKAYSKLKKNRSSICLNCLVGATNGKTNFLELNAEKFPELAMLSGEQKFFSDENLAYLRDLLNKYGGTCKFIPMRIRKLNDILLEYNVFEIDFLSIDIEGGELEVLSEIDFDTFKIHIMTVENNAREANQEIKQFLESKGFNFVMRIEQDEIYENAYWQMK